MKPIRKVFDVYHNGRVLVKVTSAWGAKAEEKAGRMMQVDSRSLCAIESSSSYMDVEIAKANSISRFKKFGLIR
jgi:hypothetical protein